MVPVVRGHEELAAMLRVVIAVRARRVLHHHRRSVGTFPWRDLVDLRTSGTSPRHATVTWTRSRRSIGHLPLCFSAITEWTGHVQIESRRTAASAILQIGQFPFAASNTSACVVPSGRATPFIGQAQEIGGSSTSAARRALCCALTGFGSNPSGRREPWTAAGPAGMP